MPVPVIPKDEDVFVGWNLINVQQSPCTLLQVLVNYAIVADCGESATQRCIVGRNLITPRQLSE
jgi:hypothetical protein